MENFSSDDVHAISDIVLQAKSEAYKETEFEPEPELTKKQEWPVQCTVGPGLEGAIACETKIGYVNGTKGWLIYRGYDIFDLCAHSSFEEVSYLLLHGKLPKANQLQDYRAKLAEYRYLTETNRSLMSFPVQDMSPMAALRLGTLLMRQKQTFRDKDAATPKTASIAADEDSIPMETKPIGYQHAIYEFSKKQYKKPAKESKKVHSAEGMESCYKLIAGVSTIAASIARLRAGHLPIEPDPELGHAANLLYMITGRRPTPVEERIMDICLILHADHGMNASTFAAMVVASTLSDIYFSIGSGIAALNGPLHGGANEQVMRMLEGIGSEENLDAWFESQLASKSKINGFGHRVYKAYDPRARVLAPLAEILVEQHPEMSGLFKTAASLETKVLDTLGKEKKIFPNVDYYSGFVYKSLGIPTDFFTPMFAVARVAGWTARVLEYLKHNRIFRPRAIYTGKFGSEYTPLDER
ncbi:MAG: citrate/2-methylcitrate synthase [bacterium]